MVSVLSTFPSRIERSGISSDDRLRPCHHTGFFISGIRIIAVKAAVKIIVSMIIIVQFIVY